MSGFKNSTLLPATPDLGPIPRPRPSPAPTISFSEMLRNRPIPQIDHQRNKKESRNAGMTALGKNPAEMPLDIEGLAPGFRSPKFCPTNRASGIALIQNCSGRTLEPNNLGPAGVSQRLKWVSKQYLLAASTRSRPGVIATTEFGWWACESHLPRPTFVGKCFFNEWPLRCIFGAQKTVVVAKIQNPFPGRKLDSEHNMIIFFFQWKK